MAFDWATRLRRCFARPKCKQALRRQGHRTSSSRRQNSGLLRSHQDSGARSLSTNPNTKPFSAKSIDCKSAQQFNLLVAPLALEINMRCFTDRYQKKLHYQTPQTSDVIQKEIFVLLCDYRCKDEEMNEPAVPIDA
jgi:hypothetical protein